MRRPILAAMLVCAKIMDNKEFSVVSHIYNSDTVEYQRLSRIESEIVTTVKILSPFAVGIHGWIVYSLVGLLLGLVAYRENLPMTMKSCFYPLIGDRIFGWMGDLIDVVSIMTTLFGVCTSLGLGTRQLNAGFNMINSDIPADDVTIQVSNYVVRPVCREDF